MSSALQRAVEAYSTEPAPACPDRPTGTGCESCASLGHRLRTLASDAAASRAPGTLLGRLNPVVDGALREMEASLFDGASIAQVAAAYARLADDAVAGVFQLASLLAEVRISTTRIGVAALGSYGRRALLPRAALELLMLTPDEAHERTMAERMASELDVGLRKLGLRVVCTVGTVDRCRALILDEPRLRVSYWTARHLAGPYGRWAELVARLEAPRRSGTRPIARS